MIGIIGRNVGMRDMSLFESLGFEWDRTVVAHDVPVYSLERVCFRFHRLLPEFVWDAGVLEGNPFTFPEVQTLLEGITVGGHKLSDQDQILNLAKSSRQLLALVKAHAFRVDKPTFCALHAMVAESEALEWGHFRGEGHEVHYTPDVGLGEAGRYTPAPTMAGAPQLNVIFESGWRSLQDGVENPYEQALAFFLFGALPQFFFDGNKRTSRLMMNGILMAHGMDAISIPAVKAYDFNEIMIRFYVGKNGTEMMRFLAEC